LLRGADIGGDMDRHRHDHRLLRTAGVEDFHIVIIIAAGALIQRALDPIVGEFLPGLERLGEFIMFGAPSIEGAHADAEDIGDLAISGAVAAQLARLFGIFGAIGGGASCRHEA